MTTLGRWPRPAGGANGACLSVNTEKWFYSGPSTPAFYPCPSRLTIDASDFVIGARNGRMSINFAGRGKVGGNCGGTDAYVSMAGFNDTIMTIDVWRALNDGVWSSSCAILVYLATPAPQPAGRVSYTILYSLAAASYTHKAGVTADVTGGCPSTLQATITVMDDGTLGIA